MAEKNDRDDEEQDQKDETVEEENAKEKAALTDEKVHEDEDDHDEEEEAKPAAKPVARAAAVKPAVTKRGAAPLGKKGRPVPVRKGGSLGKSMILFVVIVAGLAAAFVLLGENSSSGPAAPKWKIGESVDLDLTLVADDKKNLACAAPEEIAGARCAFEDKTKARPAGDTADDKKLLKPYTTVDHVQILASGVWSDPALTGTLPTTRFTVKCKYKVEGKVKAASMRWASDGPWYDSKDVYSGSISGCKLAQ